jgi:hypothetical protein
MICEPMAGDRLEQNLNPVGRLYYAASTMICVPTSLSQEVGTALGAQAGGQAARSHSQGRLQERTSRRRDALQYDHRSEAVARAFSVPIVSERRSTSF